MNKNLPLISVIIPVYKVEKYLDRCLNSVVSQDYRELEIILVDDGSPDNCPVMCDKWAEKDPRIKVIHKENGGLSSARNMGLNTSSGEYISFIDSDDYVDSSFISRMYEQIKADSSNMVICEYEFVDENGSFTPHYKILENTVTDQNGFWKLFAGKQNIYCVVSCNKLYKADIWKKLRFIEGKFNEDNYAILDIVSQCASISILKDPMYYYFRRSDSITLNVGIKNLDGIIPLLDTALYLYDRNMQHEAVSVLGIAASGMSHIYQHLDFKNKDHSRVYSEIKKQYKTVYKKICRRSGITEGRIKCFLCYYSENLYVIITDFAKKLLGNRDKS